MYVFRFAVWTDHKWQTFCLKTYKNRVQVAKDKKSRGYLDAIFSQVTGACFDLVLTSRERPSDMVYVAAFGNRDNENRFCRFIRRGGPLAANQCLDQEIFFYNTNKKKTTWNIRYNFYCIRNFVGSTFTLYNSII